MAANVIRGRVHINEPALTRIHMVGIPDAESVPWKVHALLSLHGFKTIQSRATPTMNAVDKCSEKLARNLRLKFYFGQIKRNSM